MEFWLIIIALLLYFYLVTCTFLSVQIALLKGRRKAWGWLGLVLGVVGLVIVCFIPNAKGVTGETNPVKVALKKLTGVSPLVTWIFVAGVIVVVGGALGATRLTTYLEDRAYEKELKTEAGTLQTVSPTLVAGPLGGVFCGDKNNFAVTEAGALYGWGAVGISAMDESGKLYDQVLKVEYAGETCFVLTKDHVLYGRGDNQKGIIAGQSAPYVENFVKIESDVKDFSVCATVGALVKNSGNLYVFGTNTYGQLGLAAEKITDTNSRLADQVTKVVVTKRSLYFLKNDGNVYACGSNAYGQFGLGNKDAQLIPALIAGGCKDLAAGEDFTLLLKTDGSVWSAGSDALGQLGRVTLEESDYQPKEGETTAPPPAANVFGQVTGLEGVASVKAGGSTALALVNGTLYGWGDNRMDQLKEEKALSYGAPMVVQEKVLLYDVSESCLLLYTTDQKLLGAGDRRNHQLGADKNAKGIQPVATVKGGNA